MPYWERDNDSTVNEFHLRLWESFQHSWENWSARKETFHTGHVIVLKIKTKWNGHLQKMLGFAKVSPIFMKTIKDLNV